MTSNNKLLSSAIQAARHQCGLTQDELARKLRCSSTTVQAWEHGLWKPSPERWAMLTEELGDALVRALNGMPFNTTKVVRVSIARALRLAREDGCSSESSYEIGKMALQYARRLVAETFNRRYSDNCLEIPWKLPESPSLKQPSYIYVEDGEIYVLENTIDYDWNRYLKKNFLVAQLVLRDEDEDRDFFEEDVNDSTSIVLADSDCGECGQVSSDGVHCS